MTKESLLVLTENSLENKTGCIRLLTQFLNEYGNLRFLFKYNVNIINLMVEYTYYKMSKSKKRQTNTFHS